jgi:hypothetical protein
MSDGLKHLSHAIEEDFRTLAQDIRNIQESADRYRAQSLPAEVIDEVSF